MKRALVSILSVRSSLAKLGADLNLARRKRLITEAMMAERIGISRGTYRRIEAGDPAVSIGAYATALFALGLGTPLSQIADPSTDEIGLALDAERVPKRVRPRKQPQSTKPEPGELYQDTQIRSPTGTAQQLIDEDRAERFDEIRTKPRGL